MKIVADKNMPLLADTFGRHGEVQLLNGREICTADLVDAEVLLVRSVTRVNESLLSGTGIRFVGSATIGGKHPTKNLLDSRQLEKLQPNTLLVNTSRGGVIEKSGLLAQLNSGRLQAALDVWPDEPFIEAEMLHAVTVATPHVAGYSREGKQAGTEMIYQAFCKAFALSSPTEPTSNIETVILDFPPATSTGEVLEQSIQSSSQVIRDDAALRQLPPVSQADKRVHIDSLRAAYPERYEFKSHLLRGVSDADRNLMNQLGFKTN